MSKIEVRRVGIVGLGKMGQPMARHLREAGFEVTGYDIDERARTEASRSGVAIAADPGAVAQRRRCCSLRTGSPPPRAPA
jgi:3-hydroxyisobutyrate dehydrogenase-like beta-hydroxyacid dehydrogenase